MSKNIHLLAIDVQNDFANPTGSLFVSGADQDAKRLSKFINKMGKEISDIHVTLDSHKCIQIFFSIFWVDSEGNHPKIFTIITLDDIDSGKWKCFKPEWQGRAANYVRQLAKNGRYPLIIWTDHCIEGGWGNSLVPSFSDSLIKWEKDNFKSVNYLRKGSSTFTENYSVYSADVTDPLDKSTWPNTQLKSILEPADEILVGGEALSHCVAASIRDLNRAGIEASKFVLLRDTTSNVPTFEKFGEDFIKEMTERGMRVTTTEDYLA